MTELPKGWVECLLSDVADINPALDRCPFPLDADVHFVPMSAVEAETGKVDVSAARPYPEVRKGYTAFVEGDVIFAKITPCMENGKVAVVPHLERAVACGSTEFHVLRPKTALNPHFLYFVVSSKAFRYEAEHNMTGAVGQKRVPASFMADHAIRLPPLAEQHRIVAKIEALFSELDAGEESLIRARAQLGLYRQSLLKAAFQGHLTADWRAANAGKLETPEALLSRIRKEREAWYRSEQEAWEERCAEWNAKGRVGPRPSRPDAYVQSALVSEEEAASLVHLPEGWTFARLCDLAYVGSGVSVSKDRTHDDPVEVAYLRVANVQRGRLDLAQIKTMPVEKSQLPSLALRPLDILFNEGGDRDKLGRGWVWENAIAPCITQNHVFRATLYRATEAAAKLVSHWGNSQGQDYFEKGGKQTTNLASINKSVLKALPVPVMSAAEAELLYERLEAALSELDSTETEITTGLAKIAALRQSILKKAFSGTLVPQDPADEPAAALLARIRAEAAPTGPKRKKTTMRKQTEKV